MIRSMTAFARVNSKTKSGGWDLELRSINHRFFEFSSKFPPALDAFETKIKDAVHGLIRRGKVTLSISRSNEQDEVLRNVEINEPVLKAYLSAVRKLGKIKEVEKGISAADLLKLPGVVTLEADPSANTVSWPELEKSIRKVVTQFISMKEREGRKLEADIRLRLKQIMQSTVSIEKAAANRSKSVYDKLKQHLDELLQDRQKDEDRLYREAAFLAEKADITEEIVRLKSHIELFGKRLSEETELGRELDFLCQEMNREINTIGSKAQLFEIAKEVVFVKGELEKIREQIQNIE